ncbi:MAG: octaprenyl diphosphate synthase [Ferrovum sp. 37-45-19]|uniref:octaprenyl diphosphate synthase n=1 Tax=Ferrovum sp. JA12 TaxID=1356299 RepID=UPI000715532A|nr:octaprenyl diphosphate synthase [Ferrovum sp. JA12]OYV79814.1 MAG: octaprenyl diphosphate synthase [Ferrovum sp. 21-44-67]OYV95437.1 MAG: octaprenyl diphosphate synthase [Ferrovum sp. 37-45-19]OZB31486.1 MAG: octaprenyl diphosphate synthase [Ferrovum sp. 34-44-207]HQT81231.1 octaprenyl diphosphate synthase [Ferrovaceae bacterium]KRH78118.1 octaprenyl-diphosphate synthase [Ferrovum sp. JA12]
MKFEDIKTLSLGDMAAVDEVIRKQLYSDVVLVRQVAEYIIHSGGKRLRPLITVLMAKAFGYQGNDHHVLAAVVEFIHTATLLHDDVVDKSDMRRGKKTANELFGNAASVLVGDFLYSRAFQMMVSIERMSVMEILANATNIIAEGEVLQLLNCHDPEVDEARYRQVIQYKTAQLFSAAGQLGALIADQDIQQQILARDYGTYLGNAFQIIDDALDYSGNSSEMGKNLGDDLAEGKATLPLIQAMKVASDEDRDFLRSVIIEGGTAQIDRVMSIINTTDALTYTKQCAQLEVDKAIDAIQQLPDSPYRQALESLANLSVDRNH